MSFWGYRRHTGLNAAIEQAPMIFPPLPCLTICLPVIRGWTLRVMSKFSLLTCFSIAKESSSDVDLFNVSKVNVDTDLWVLSPIELYPILRQILQKVSLEWLFQHLLSLPFLFNEIVGEMIRFEPTLSSPKCSTTSLTIRWTSASTLTSAMIQRDFRPVNSNQFESLLMFDLHETSELLTCCTYPLPRSHSVQLATLRSDVEYHWPTRS